VATTFSGDTVRLTAGNDLTVRGSNVTAAHDLALVAGRDVVIDTAQDTTHETHVRKESRSGFSASMGGVSYGSSSLRQNSDGTTVTQVASTLSGENVALTSGRDTLIRAANVLADQDVTVLAGRDIAVLAAADTQTLETQTRSKSSSFGLTPDVFGKMTIYGKTQASQDTDGAVVSQRTALLSANTGDLTLRAGLDAQYKGSGQGNVLTQGADLLAAETIAISGNAVDLQAVANVASSHSVEKTKSVTVGAALAGGLGSQITAISDAVDRARDTDNDRLKGALALKAGYDAYKLSQGRETTKTMAEGTDPNAPATPTPATPSTVPGAGSGFASSGLGVSVSLGVSKSRSESSSRETTVTGTNLQAKTIDIEATETDLSMAAAKLQAEDIALSAQRDILLEAAANQSEIHSKNKSNSAGIGVTFAFGGQQNGFSFQLNASQAKGKANGSETVWDNTLITASDSLTVKSGRDTTLKGAQLAGDTVKFDIGRDLLIESLQDSSTYTSKQSSSGFNLSLCIPPICGGTMVTGSVSASDQKIKHNYQSAVGQSGIAAGDGGFDITVGQHTDLVGAAITSTAGADQNSLTTASLTSRDLENAQNTKAKSSSLSMAYGGGSLLTTLAGNATSNLLGNLTGNAALPENGKETSQTLSVISPATISISGSGNSATDEASRQTADTLTARDPATANQSLSNSLSLQQAQVLETKIKEQKENQEAANLVGAVLSNMVGDYAQSMQKPVTDARLRQDLDNRQANGESLNEAEIQALARLDAEGMTSAKALATLADPEALARAATWADGSLAKTALHGLVGLIEAKVGNGNAASGVLGGVTQEQLAPVLSEYLTDQGIVSGSAEYKTLMQLGTTLAGTAIGAAAGGTQGAATAANAAFVGVTNNQLLHPQQVDRIKKKAQALDGKEGKSAAQWEKELIQQLLKENDDAYAGFAENVQARAILADLQKTTGVVMNVENDKELYTNRAINGQYATQLAESYNLAGLPSNVMPTLPLAKVLSDALTSGGFITQDKATQRSIYEQVQSLLYGGTDLPSGKSAWDQLVAGQISSEQYNKIEQARLLLDNALSSSERSIRNAGILTPSELDQLNTSNTAFVAAFALGGRIASGTKVGSGGGNGVNSGRAEFIGPTIGKSGFTSADELAGETYARYQKYTDLAYQRALDAEASGKLVIPAGVPRETGLGQYTDRFAQSMMKGWFRSEGISKGSSSVIQVNRWLRDPAGTGAYRIPDVRTPNYIFDGTIGYKWSTTPQIVDFTKYSGGSRVTIVRPTDLGGSYSIVP